MRYLGQHPDAALSDIQGRCPEWFSFAGRVAEHCSSVALSLRFSPNDMKAVYSAAMYSRIVRSLEAGLALASRGLLTEASVIDRYGFEALILLVGFAEKEGQVEAYVRSHDARRPKLLRKLKCVPADERAAIASAEWFEQMERQAPAMAEGAQVLNLEAVATGTSVHKLYLTKYAHLSGAAHHLPNDLQRHFRLSDEKKLLGLTWGPDPESPGHLLDGLTSNCLLALMPLSAIFDLEDSIGEPPALMAEREVLRCGLGLSE